MRQVQLTLLSLLFVATVAAMACGDDDDNGGPSGQGGSDQTISDSLQISALGTAFDKVRLIAPANSEVSILFQNEDAGITHNIAIYESRDASELVFRGELFAGVADRTYRFTSPNPGSYFFRCDNHPDTMMGSFVAQ
jgi:plastocyanin